MNVKKIVVLFFILTFVGCRTRPAVTDINRPIIEHSIEIERSQNIQRELITTIDRASERLDAIGKSAELLSGNIGEIIDLFVEYDRTVREFIEELQSVIDRNRIGETENKYTE